MYSNGQKNVEKRSSKWGSSHAEIKERKWKSDETTSKVVKFDYQSLVFILSRMSQTKVIKVQMNTFRANNQTNFLTSLCTTRYQNPNYTSTRISCGYIQSTNQNPVPRNLALYRSNGAGQYYVWSNSVQLIVIY